jgi:hypothetical protein
MTEHAHDTGNLTTQRRDAELARRLSPATADIERIALEAAIIQGMSTPTPSIVRRYAKFLVAGASLAAVVAQALIAGDYTTVEGVVAVGLAVAGALGVKQVSNG